MNFNSIGRIFFLLFFLSLNTTSLAKSKLSTTTHQLHHFANKFSFDWNNYRTIYDSKTALIDTENYLKSIKRFSSLSPEDKKVLGKLYYRLGTYYTHFMHEPHLALVKLHRAAFLTKNKEDRAWINAHLAYAYIQKAREDEKFDDYDRALSNINTILKKQSDASKPLTGFVYGLKGQIESDRKNLVAAEKYYRKAIHVYETVPDDYSEQYARINNRLAQTLLDQDKDSEAIQALNKIKQYWTKRASPNYSPYAARNLLSLGQAYLKTGNPELAKEELEHAVHIYEIVYGRESSILIEPYQWLSLAFQQTNEPNKALLYSQKASVMQNKLTFLT